VKREILKKIHIIQTKKDDEGYFIGNRLNPFNPLSYIVFVLFGIIGLIMFGVVGFWKETDGNPFSWKR